MGPCPTLPSSSTASGNYLLPRHCGRGSPASLTCNCYLFSGPQNSSVSKNKPLSRLHPAVAFWDTGSNNGFLLQFWTALPEERLSHQITTLNRKLIKGQWVSQSVVTKDTWLALWLRLWFCPHLLARTLSYFSLCSLSFSPCVSPVLSLLLQFPMLFLSVVYSLSFVTLTLLIHRIA
jgi:hypothetical protein